MSCSVASSSRASRSASSPNERSSSADISLTSAPTVRAPDAGLATKASSATQPLLDVRELERVDDRLDVAVHHAWQIVRREADAMIRDAALRIVVRPDLRRAVAGAHLRLPHSRTRRLLLAHAQVEQPCAQDLHRLQLVLQLRLLVLLRDVRP